MNLQDAIALIQQDIPPQATLWTDLGCGSGLFTRALATMLAKGSTIYAIDTQPSLHAETTSGGVAIQPMTLDFVKDPLPLPALNGVLMANALHYVKDKPAFLRKLQAGLQPGAVFLIVEYDTDTPVPTWVPYPLSFTSLKKLFATAGYQQVKPLGRRPSVYGRAEIYAAWIS
ncbi:class I SAM-dependent methyltransferase [Chitinophaga vietnamensis]|uniref:class I SAM-dependent methyltransferase n=1 Tax=Chitinophaga vietnamensis TaxID=2593957 RepID=UPI0011776949|nr:methyltransferase [Chitinophaga vietnamensis]